MKKVKIFKEMKKILPKPAKIEKKDSIHRNNKLNKNRSLIYSIQEHHATHLHWDLRLESPDGNGLLSWAIPKSPPRRAGILRLAIQTPIHPTSSWNFEGIIPKGEYGAGKVNLWDKGYYYPLDMSNDKIVIEIKGDKLKGFFYLIKTKYGKSKKEEWLLGKMKYNKKHIIE